MTNVEENTRKNIIFHRDRLGLKDSDIAKYCGISKSTVHFWITGKNSVSLDNFIKLCDLFGVTADELVR